MLLGHKGRCFDIRVDGSGEYAVSASEDGTSRVFHLDSKACRSTLLHNKDAEVLRAAFVPSSSSHRIVTCGSDSKAILWTADDEFKFEKTYQLVHLADQIYTCELIPHRHSSLLTAADECLYIWDLERRVDEPLSCVPMSPINSTQPFGGHRNPESKAFIFDGKFAPNNSVCGLEGNAFALALSDGM